MKVATTGSDRNDAAVPPAVFVVDGDPALSYLLERYAERSGFRFCGITAPWRASLSSRAGPAALWLPSLERLETVRPREAGLVGDDSPVIVCALAGDEARAHELGADVCVFHPLSYEDFLAALRSVGATREQAPTSAAERDEE